MSTNSLKSPIPNGNQQQQLPVFLQNHQLYLQQQQPIYALSHMEYAYFHNDRFELIVNVKGYKPEDIRVNVLVDKIELLTQKPLTQTQQNIITTRLYQLPQRICPCSGYCQINSEGVLLIWAPWCNY
ncbi:hypothetical protein CBL_06311 [Carabus blaptoides fortunei]